MTTDWRKLDLDWGSVREVAEEYVADMLAEETDPMARHGIAIHRQLITDKVELEFRRGLMATAMAWDKPDA